MKFRDRRLMLAQEERHINPEMVIDSDKYSKFQTARSAHHYFRIAREELGPTRLRLRPVPEFGKIITREEVEVLKTIVDQIYTVVERHESDMGHLRNRLTLLERE